MGTDLGFRWSTATAVTAGCLWPARSTASRGADGSRLAFVVYGYPQAQLETVPSGGGTPTLLASFGTEQDAQPIAWSPDGGRILLARTTYKPGDGDWDTSGVDAYPADGGAPHVVLASQNEILYNGVVYSPDASQIAMSTLARAPLQQPNATVRSGGPSPPSALHGLLIANADGSAATQVASFPSLAAVVGWFPRVAPTDSRAAIVVFSGVASPGRISGRPNTTLPTSRRRCPRPPAVGPGWVRPGSPSASDTARVV